MLLNISRQFPALCAVCPKGRRAHFRTLGLSSKATRSLPAVQSRNRRGCSQSNSPADGCALSIQRDKGNMAAELMAIAFR
jgi:hypothetical protein